MVLGKTEKLKFNVVTSFTFIFLEQQNKNGDWNKNQI